MYKNNWYKTFSFNRYRFCFIYLFCDQIGRYALRWTWLSQIGPQAKIIAHRCISGWLWRHCCSNVRPIFPKLGANYPLWVMCNSSRDNAEPKPQCCSVLLFLWRKILRVIRHNRYYDLSYGSNILGTAVPVVDVTMWLGNALIVTAGYVIILELSSIVFQCIWLRK